MMERRWWGLSALALRASSQVRVRSDLLAGSAAVCCLSELWASRSGSAESSSHLAWLQPTRMCGCRGYECSSIWCRHHPRHCHHGYSDGTAHSAAEVRLLISADKAFFAACGPPVNVPCMLGSLQSHDFNCSQVLLLVCLQCQCP